MREGIILNYESTATLKKGVTHLIISMFVLLVNFIIKLSRIHIFFGIFSIFSPVFLSYVLIYANLDVLSLLLLNLKISGQYTVLLPFYFAEFLRILALPFAIYSFKFGALKSIFALQIVVAMINIGLSTVAIKELNFQMIGGLYAGLYLTYFIFAVYLFREKNESSR